MSEEGRPARRALDIGERKNQHIDICLNEDVEGRGEGTGFDRYRFVHSALPELDFRAIDIGAAFLGKRTKTPFMISSMTGGTDEAGRINVRLAEMAERKGWSMGLGSLRAAIEQPERAASFRVRRFAPGIPLLANLGAAQLNAGFGADECRQAMALAEADGLVLHLNGMQELFQDEGDVDFSGLLRRIERLCRDAEFPVGVKEVGFGIDGATARRLTDAGVSFVDVAGAGGTSWIEVEKYRSADPVRREAAHAFLDWGIPTAECVVGVRAAVPGTTIVASGGMHNGVDAAKAIALGANVVSYGRTLLAPALGTDEELERTFDRIAFELRAAMFGIGAGDLDRLRRTDRLAKVRW
ncbi:type 2 isopentenyl-diphosphate Delta-isomerase [Cohnella suwonensis]|uniref:Isopentenyl-diphosphate delta-isomerase n=1 Tax=Cohnella suwonensis TaxID=696072 RepID=A0ABW0LQW6_9BACL